VPGAGAHRPRGCGGHECAGRGGRRLGLTQRSAGNTASRPGRSGASRTSRSASAIGDHPALLHEAAADATPLRGRPARRDWGISTSRPVHRREVGSIHRVTINRHNIVKEWAYRRPVAMGVLWNGTRPKQWFRTGSVHTETPARAGTPICARPVARATAAPSDHSRPQCWRQPMLPETRHAVHRAGMTTLGHDELIQFQRINSSLPSLEHGTTRDFALHRRP
jgi:hypothetical protein